MTKKKAIHYDQNLIRALRKLPSPIRDVRHNLTVYLDDRQARSNQSRFEHIARNFHELTVKDIESIPKGIVLESKLKKDKVRKDTYNYYFPRKRNDGRFIKISIKIEDYEKRTAIIKTIFVAKMTK